MIIAESWVDQRPWVLTLTATIVLGIVGLVVGYIYHRRGQTRKCLDYLITSDVKLLSDEATKLGSLEVTYESHALKHPRVVTIKFTNTGNKEIKAEDFEDPIKIQHPGSRAYGFFELEATRPKMLTSITDGGTTPGGRYITVVPRLMNKGDSFTMQMIYDGPERIEVSSWIVGQTRDMRVQETSRDRFDALWKISILASFAVWLGVLGGISLSDTDGRTDVATVGTVFVILSGVAFVLTGLLLALRFRRSV